MRLICVKCMSFCMIVVALLGKNANFFVAV